MDPNDADDEGEEEEVFDDARITSKDGANDEVRVIFDGSSTQLRKRPD